MTKSLIILNEPLSEMFLGKNTTLAYVIACFELGFEIYILNLASSKTFPAENSETNLAQNLEVDILNRQNLTLIAKKFRQENLAIRKLAQSCQYEELTKLKTAKLGEFISENFSQRILLKISEIDLVLQRLEPMKSPFPPEGNEAVAEILKELQKTFPFHIFNLPLSDQNQELEDKDVPQEINKISQQQIATPTFEFEIKDEKFAEKINLAAKKYEEIYGKKSSQKIVIKPKNSAQSLGVFALEIGDDVTEIDFTKMSIADLSNLQIYPVKKSQIEQKIIKLCFIQRVKKDKSYHDKKITDFSSKEITEKAAELYNAKVLLQPFLEGIAQGDIRANILKNSEGNFYCAGYCFRSSNHNSIAKNFTTGYITGSSVSKPISFLTKGEQENIIKKTELILQILNQDLRQKYRKILELGIDFILVGNDEMVMLGEINHHCQGLLPISEAMDLAEKNYDEGIGLAKKAICDWAKMNPKN